MKKTFGRDPWAATWSTTKSSVVSHDFHPIRDFRFLEGPKFCRRFSKIFGKNLRRISKTFETTLESLHSSAKTALGAHDTFKTLQNLPTLKNLQNLRCRSAHCLQVQPVIPVPLQGGGRSSERCSEGPDVLVYIL